MRKGEERRGTNLAARLVGGEGERRAADPIELGGLLVEG